MHHKSIAANMKRAGYGLTCTKTCLLANGLYIYLFHPDSVDRGPGENPTQEIAR
jgi:hypothetical protein